MMRVIDNLDSIAPSALKAAEERVVRRTVSAAVYAAVTVAVYDAVTVAVYDAAGDAASTAIDREIGRP